MASSTFVFVSSNSGAGVVLFTCPVQLLSYHPYVTDRVVFTFRLTPTEAFKSASGCLQDNHFNCLTDLGQNNIQDCLAEVLSTAKTIASIFFPPNGLRFVRQFHELSYLPFICIAQWFNCLALVVFVLPLLELSLQPCNCLIFNCLSSSMLCL